jgi:hypothetical protein
VCAVGSSIRAVIFTSSCVCRCPPYNIGKLDLAANNLTGPIISELGLLTAMGKWLNLTCDWSCGLLVPNLATHILVPFALANSESLNLGTNQLASSIPEPLFGLVNLGAYERGWACVFCCVIRL